MAKLTSYSAVTTLNDGMFIYTAIDTNADGTYESRSFTLGVLRSELYGTNSNIIKLSKGADITAAAVLPIGIDGNHFDVIGTTTITSFSAIGVGTVVVLEFDATLTLTHHITNLFLPGAADIITSSRDTAAFVEVATGQWRCLYYIRADAPPRPQGAITPFYLDAAPQALSGPGAVDITSPITNFTSTGATDALTLADATIPGQVKVLNHSVDGGGYVLTPTTMAGGNTTITVTDLSVSITLMWTGGGWQLMSQTGVATVA